MFRVDQYLAHRSTVTESELVPILSLQNDDVIIRTSRKWPRTYWIILKLLCLFHGKKIVSTRKCHQCRLTKLEYKRKRDASGPLPNYQFPAAVSSPAGWHDDDEEHPLRDENVNLIQDQDEDDVCDVCRSHWWNADGTDEEYTEDEIGVTNWNHRGSLHLSVFLQLACIAFLLYDCAIYLILYWGNTKQLLRLLSYSTYFGNLAAIPAICLLANLRNMIPRTRVSCFSLTTALHPRYIVKRLQYLRPNSSGIIRKPFLLLCVTWPFCNSLYRAIIYIFLVMGTGGYHLHDYITICSNGVIAVLYGCFCYLISILRVSINTQLDLDVAFLRKHISKADICRRRLGESLDEYGSLCSLCAMWMIFVMSMNSLGLVTHISWNYLLYSGNLPITVIETNINIMIWSETLMFLMLPPMAIGGLDLHHIWEDFLTRICEVRCDIFHSFWDKIVKFVTHEFNPVTNVVQLTLLFSVISLYMALQVGDQNATYWGKLNITATAIGPPIM